MLRHRPLYVVLITHMAGLNLCTRLTLTLSTVHGTLTVVELNDKFFAVRIPVPTRVQCWGREDTKDILIN